MLDVNSLKSKLNAANLDFRKDIYNNCFSTKLTMYGIKYTEYFNLNNYIYDFILEDGKTLISLAKSNIDKNYYKELSKNAKDNNYRCIHIFEWEDKDKIINSLLLPKEKVYARKCQVKEVDKNTAADFINTYHLQGYAKDSIRIGLYLNEELISIMTFGKPRFNNNYEYELIRYCSSKSVIGGSAKLFTYFINNYKPTSIISYCDLSKFNGDTYAKLGFTSVRKPQPSKHWYNSKTKKHFLDSLVRKHGYSRLINKISAEDDNVPTSNNKLLMASAGYKEVYDAGQAAYVWKKDFD